MRTEDLIARLAKDTPVVPRRAVERRLARNLALAAILGMGVVLLFLGLRPDLRAAVAGGSFWMKFGYTAVVGAVGVDLARQLARPGAKPVAAPWLVLGAATIALAILAGLELADAAPADRMTLWLGRSWRTCPFWILAISAPLLAGGLLAMRRFAPTAPAAAGLALGLAAGGLGATLYGLHCQESTAAFLATWYVLGMAVVGAFGAVAGVRFLRW